MAITRLRNVDNIREIMAYVVFRIAFLSITFGGFRFWWRRLRWNLPCSCSRSSAWCTTTHGSSNYDWERFLKRYFDVLIGIFAATISKLFKYWQIYVCINDVFLISLFHCSRKIISVGQVGARDSHNTFQWHVHFDRNNIYFVFENIGGLSGLLLSSRRSSCFIAKNTHVRSIKKIITKKLRDFNYPFFALSSEGFGLRTERTDAGSDAPIFA